MKAYASLIEFVSKGADLPHRPPDFRLTWLTTCLLPYALPFVFQIAYAAVDCAKEQNHDLCKQEGVDGYPTFNYYNYGKFVEKYNGERGVSTGGGCGKKPRTNNCLFHFCSEGRVRENGWLLQYTV